MRQGGERMPSFHQQSSAVFPGAVFFPVLSVVDVNPLPTHWGCSLAERCLGFQLCTQPQLTLYLVVLMSVEASPLERSFTKDKRNFFTQRIIC